jgi:hypothetical protein
MQFLAITILTFLVSIQPSTVGATGAFLAYCSDVWEQPYHATKDCK